MYLCKLKYFISVTQIVRSGLCVGDTEAFSSVEMSQLNRTWPRVLGKEVF